MVFVVFTLCLGGCKSSKTATSSSASRAQALTNMEQKQKLYDSCWHRMTPTCKPWSSWGERMRLMRQTGAWAGELELLSGADKCNLKIAVLRPGGVRWQPALARASFGFCSGAPTSSPWKRLRTLRARRRAERMLLKLL
eukprot:5194790-Pyramimonas_sp.AAC.1